MFLGEVNVMRINFDEERLLLLDFENASDVGSARCVQSLPGHHPLLIGRHHEDGDFRIVTGDTTDLIEAARIAIALTVYGQPHALQALCSERADLRATLADA